MTSRSAFALVLLTSLGWALGAFAAERHQVAAKTRVVTDIEAHLAGVPSVKVGVLSAEVIKAGAPTTLKFRVDGDQEFKVDLSAGDLKLLSLGLTVQRESNRIQGNSHSILFDPARNPTPAKQAELPGLPQLFLKLEDDEEGRLGLFVATSTAVEPDSVALCWGYASDCPDQSSRWQTLEATSESSPGVATFKVTALAIKGDRLRVRAKSKSGEMIYSIFSIEERAASTTVGRGS